MRNRADLHAAMRSNTPNTVLFPSDSIKMAFEHFAQRWERFGTQRDLEIASGLWEVIQQSSPEEADGNEFLIQQIDTWIRG